MNLSLSANFRRPCFSSGWSLRCGIDNDVGGAAHTVLESGLLYLFSSSGASSSVLLSTLRIDKNLLPSLCSYNPSLARHSDTKDSEGVAPTLASCLRLHCTNTWMDDLALRLQWKCNSVPSHPLSMSSPPSVGGRTFLRSSLVASIFWVVCHTGILEKSLVQRPCAAQSPSRFSRFLWPRARTFPTRRI